MNEYILTMPHRQSYVISEAVILRSHYDVFQAAVLCGCRASENRRKSQIYRRENCEGTAMTAIKT